MPYHHKYHRSLPWFFFFRSMRRFFKKNFYLQINVCMYLSILYTDPCPKDTGDIYEIWKWLNYRETS